MTVEFRGGPWDGLTLTPKRELGEGEQFRIAQVTKNPRKFENLVGHYEYRHGELHWLPEEDSIYDDITPVEPFG